MNFARGFEPLCQSDTWYFVGGNGLAYCFGAISKNIEDLAYKPGQTHPSKLTRDQQLDALNLLNEFITGHSPFILPLSFYRS